MAISVFPVFEDFAAEIGDLDLTQAQDEVVIDSEHTAFALDSRGGSDSRESFAFARREAVHSEGFQKQKKPLNRSCSLASCHSPCRRSSTDRTSAS